jgi:hypothetical protein
VIKNSAGDDAPHAAFGAVVDHSSIAARNSCF